MSNRSYHSSFIVDVSISDTLVTLTDSTRGRYSVDLTDKEVFGQFKTWLHTVFLKGIPQQLTVFEYKDVGSGADFDFRITKFCNLKQEEGGTQLNG